MVTDIILRKLLPLGTVAHLRVNREIERVVRCFAMRQLLTNRAFSLETSFDQHRTSLSILTPQTLCQNQATI